MFNKLLKNKQSVNTSNVLSKLYAKYPIYTVKQLKDEVPDANASNLNDLYKDAKEELIAKYYSNSLLVKDKHVKCVNGSKEHNLYSISKIPHYYLYYLLECCTPENIEIIMPIIKIKPILKLGDDDPIINQMSTISIGALPPQVPAEQPIVNTSTLLKRKQ
jgi:hypothetical protein